MKDHERLVFPSCFPPPSSSWIVAIMPQRCYLTLWTMYHGWSPRDGTCLGSGQLRAKGWQNRCSGRSLSVCFLTRQQAPTWLLPLSQQRVVKTAVVSLAKSSSHVGVVVATQPITSGRSSSDQNSPAVLTNKPNTSAYLRICFISPPIRLYLRNSNAYGYQSVIRIV